MRILDRKVAIVTGAGFGLGRAHAFELAAHGAAVIVNDLGTSLSGEGTSTGPAEVVARLIRDAGGRASANFDDVANWQGAERMVKQAVEEFGRLDILVNNAAIFRDKPLADLSEDDWDSVIRVHLKGTAAPIHHAVRHWRSERAAGRPPRASIINTTSRAGMIPSPAQAVRPNYVAAKGGVTALTQVLSHDLYEDGIRVNAISPTAYTRNAVVEFGRGPAIEVSEYPESSQFDRFSPSTNSPLVSYLASDRSAHVTGHIFRMDYGTRIVQMAPWREGAAVVSESGWTLESIAEALDTRVFGSRLAPPAETEAEELQRALDAQDEYAIQRRTVAHG